VTFIFDGADSRIRRSEFRRGGRKVELLPADLRGSGGDTAEIAEDGIEGGGDCGAGPIAVHESGPVQVSLSAVVG
jgi:hypothetical protein